MKAIVKPGRTAGLELADVPVPAPRAGEVLIEVKAASICGSDIPIFDWDDPWVQGVVRPGQIVGHEFAGRIAAVGSAGDEFVVGQTVTAEGHLNCGRCKLCLAGEGHVCPAVQLVGFDYPGAFAEYVAIPASNIRPWTGLAMAVAAIQDPFGNAVHAVSKVGLSGATVLVAGCGPIGLMVIKLAQVAGAHPIIASDPSEYRRRMAKELGADATVDPLQGDIESVIAEQGDAEGLDIFFEVSGDPRALIQGIRLLRGAGSAVLLGLAKRPVEFDFANDLVAKDLQVYGVVGRRLNETWAEIRRHLDSSDNPSALDLSPLITHHFLFDDFAQGFDLMKARRCGKVILYPNRASFDSGLNAS